MTGREAGDSKPDLAAEARFWREWNTAVFERTRPQAEAAAIAARLSPDPDRLAALVARTGTAAALARPAPEAAGSDLIRVHADAGRFYQSRLQGSWVPGYMAGRGLEAVFLPMSPWKIGYAPDSRTALTAHLRELGYSDETLLRSGLAAEGKNGRLYDRFRDRLMIPLRRAGDRVVVAFIGRRRPDAGDDRGPKYLNSPNTELYAKGHVLAGLAEGRRLLEHGAQPVLVEGPMDAIAVSIAAPGRFAGVAPCGTALTGEQAAALARAADLPDRGVLVALDPDRAGREAAIQAYARLSRLGGDITAAALPGGMDPAEMLEKQGPRSLGEVLTANARPLADLVVEARMRAWEHDGRLESVETQFGAIRAVGKTIATMPPRDAGRQAARVAALFITRYGWKPEEANRELIEAAEGQVAAQRSRPASAHAPAAGLPPDTAGLLTRAIAPPADGRSASVPGATSPGITPASSAARTRDNQHQRD